MMGLIKISGGTVYDPANAVRGEVRDLWIDRDTGRMVAAPGDAASKPARTIDAAGLIVMPGGVDMHCHIAGGKVNAARQMQTGKTDVVPTTRTTGLRYAGLGYTTAFDAAIAPLAARHAHLEFAQTPCIDRGGFLLMGDHELLLGAIERNEPELVRGFIAWLLHAAKGYAPKLVNPGGAERWKSGGNEIWAELDAPLGGRKLTPRQIIETVARVANELQLPHPLHLHTLNLGLPGNWRTTLATMQALEGHRAHLAHVQFHSYGGGLHDNSKFGSQVGPLVDYLNAHENLSVDVGQVLFGPTMSMTGDSAVGHYLAKLLGANWYSCDLELEAGCGVVPIEYKQQSLVHAWQWAMGLEWFVRAKNPWQVALSTDHPNGGSFLAYPQIINWLMNRDARREALAKLHPSVREHAPLRELDREYSLEEICIITRAAPARMLGLTQKGHLGVAADADVTIYTPSSQRDWRAMFELPRHVLKGGQSVIENGEFIAPVVGRTLFTSAGHDAGVVPHIERWFTERSTVGLANFEIGAEEFAGCSP